MQNDSFSHKKHCNENIFQHLWKKLKLMSWIYETLNHNIIIRNCQILFYNLLVHKPYFSPLPLPTAISRWIYQFSSDHWSQAASSPVSTWMGDRLGTRGAVGILFSIFFKNFAFSGCKIRGPIVLALRRLFRFRALYINEWNFASELQLSSLSASLKPPCQ